MSLELGCRLGTEVGYSVRFDDMSSSDTKIKYITGGSTCVASCPFVCSDVRMY